MRIAIIAIIMSIAALALATFAAVHSLNNEDTISLPPTVEASWSEAKCEAAENSLSTLKVACLNGGDCLALTDLALKIADNCP